MMNKKKLSKKKIFKIIITVFTIYMLFMALICIFKYHRYDAANTFLLILVLLEMELK